MARLRLMRAPQKYVQGKDSLLSFYEEMKELGNKWLFICSKSGHKMCHDKIEKSFALQMTAGAMKSLAVFPVSVKLKK